MGIGIFILRITVFTAYENIRRLSASSRYGISIFTSKNSMHTNKYFKKGTREMTEFEDQVITLLKKILEKLSK
jgi:hypothetical protein